MHQTGTGIVGTGENSVTAFSSSGALQVSAINGNNIHTSNGTHFPSSPRAASQALQQPHHSNNGSGSHQQQSTEAPPPKEHPLHCGSWADRKEIIRPASRDGGTHRPSDIRPSSRGGLRPGSRSGPNGGIVLPSLVPNSGWKNNAACGLPSALSLASNTILV